MKIRAIRISGFRGVPPIDPVGTEISLIDRNGGPLNLVLFGPNAYGKSSIADALEWLFKEQARGSHYFEAYTNQDNVHLNLGQPSYRTTAFIEVDLVHNGQLHTVRKELDGTGNKSSENLDSLDDELLQARDEIVILDHDQFREFVGAASKDKWTTFSGLIGYEELDLFRSGLDSLTGRSLRDILRLSAKETSLNSRRQEWNRKLQEAFRRYVEEETVPSVPAFVTRLLERLEVTLSSLEMPVPTGIGEITEEVFEAVRSRATPAGAVVQAAERMAILQQQSLALQPLGAAFESGIESFVTTANDLEQNKEAFDKQILADFYSKGLQVIAEGKSSIDECPFCGLPYEWSRLEQEVSNSLASLDVEAIKNQHNELLRQWQRLKSTLTQKSLSVNRQDLPTLKKAYDDIPSLDTVEAAIALTTFDSAVIVQWYSRVQSFLRQLESVRSEVEEQQKSVEAALALNPSGELTANIDMLQSMWHIVQTLAADEEEIAKLDRELRTTQAVVEELRTVARLFREELNDFSGRVVELINEDVRRYYDALHSNDGVKPYLEASVVGNQRIVTLRCDYLGATGRDAASLLSESHRNSLGLAILLAFMKYKRRTGSPVEFLILDDVTQSFDVGHRLSLIKFLEDPAFPEISSSQILFLTHDRTLADLVKRAGDQDRPNWLRYDIRSWQLNAMLVEPHKLDLLARAQELLTQGDELSAAVYGRHALEEVCRTIVQSTSLRMVYAPHPWRISVEKFQEAIINEVRDLWSRPVQRGAVTYNAGLINPAAVRLDEIDRALRVLHYTVHDSAFLQNPPALLEIQSAIDAVVQLRDLFTCPNCRVQTPPTYKYFRQLGRNPQGNPPNCKTCDQPLPAHNP